MNQALIYDLSFRIVHVSAFWPVYGRGLEHSIGEKGAQKNTKTPYVPMCGVGNPSPALDDDGY
jgi:hypothetical protein